MTNNCTQYNHYLNTWKEKLKGIDVLYQGFKKNGNNEIKEQIQDLKKQAEIAKQEYQDFINEIVEFEGEKIKRIDADILRKMKGLTGKLDFVITNGNINYIDVRFTKVERDKINQALSFVKYFNSLQSLDCDGTNIDYLPELQGSLKELYCSNTNIDSLPELPDSLEVLDCSYTNTDSLPELPDSLQALSCENTNIDSLPELRASLRIIYI